MSTATAYYAIPPEPGRWGAFGMAVVVHLALLVFLWIGIRWQSETPVVVEAEVWDSKIMQAAPKAIPPPVIEPETKPEPKPEPKVEAKVEPKPEPAEVSAPDIALERKRKLEKQREQEKLAAELKRKEVLKELEERNKKEKDQLKKLNALIKKEEEEKKFIEKLKQVVKREDDAKRLQAEEAAAEKLRAETMSRITGTGPATATGEAPRSTGPRGDPSYTAAIIAKIKGNLSFGGDTNVPGNPQVIFSIDQLPNGEIIGSKKLKSSGIPAFDDAVEKAIAKSSPLPKKKDGSVEREIKATFNLKE